MVHIITKPWEYDNFKGGMISISPWVSQVMGDPRSPCFSGNIHVFPAKHSGFIGGV